MPSSRLTLLAPPQGVDCGYWDTFLAQMFARLRNVCDRVVVVNALSEDRRVDADDVVVGIAPSREAAPPTQPFIWIPRMGEAVTRDHPWATASLILLPLGVGRVDATLPVFHLGAGFPADPHAGDSGSHRLATSTPEPRVVSSEGGDRFAAFLAALAGDCVPVVDAADPLLVHLCERWGVGIPCRGEAERAAACRYLAQNPSVARRIWYTRQRFIRRMLSWTEVFHRLVAALRWLNSPGPTVHTVVLNWNGRDLLPECLESLRRQNYPGQVVVLVDNGSGDESVPFTRAVFPECRIISNRRNLGFAEGNNVAMRAAIDEGADYVVLLNNDTRVARGWLRALLDAAESDPRLGAGGSRMLFYDRPRTVNSAGGAMNQALYGWDMGVFEHDGRAWRTPRPCLAVTGGSMLLRVEALRDAGVFDRAYFAYYEDNDLCHRLRLAGWKVTYVPGSKVFHKLSATSGPVSDWKTFLLERSRYRYIMKNVPLSYLARYGNRLLLQEWSELSSWWRAREYRRILIQIRAALAAAVHLPGIVWWRLVKSTGRNTGWTRELIPGFSRPTFARADDRFTDIYTGMTPEGRIIVTCVQQPLRGAWSSIHPSFPKLRWLEGEAALAMTNHRIEEGYVQVHAFVPPDRSPAELTVACSGTFEHTVTLSHPGWHTVLVPVRDLPARRVLHLASSTPLGINEVSLLPADSPLLRAM